MVSINAHVYKLLYIVTWDTTFRFSQKRTNDRDRNQTSVESLGTVFFSNLRKLRNVLLLLVLIIILI